MSKPFILAAVVMLSGVTAYGQSVVIRQGVALPGGGSYTGTEDVELLSANLDPEPGTNSENPSITVDGDDGGNVTMGALRFNDLLVSQGGLVPDEVSSGAFNITNASLSLFKLSGTEALAEIAFYQVTGVDNVTGEFWQEEDSWGSLTNNVFAVGPGDTFVEWPFGPALGEQFRPDGYTPTFPAVPSVGVPTGETGPAPTFTEPNEVITRNIGGTLFTSTDTSTDLDSENVLNFLDDVLFDPVDDQGVVTSQIGLQEGLALLEDVFAASFFSFDVTDTVVDWLVPDDLNNPASVAPNAGWAISNNTGDGWDIVTSEATGSLEDDAGFLNASDDPTVIPFVERGVNSGQLTEAMLPEGLLLGDTPGTLEVDAEFLRPTLTVFFDGGGGPGDLDFDGDADQDDYDLFLAAFGGQVDGPVSIGSTGDLDFDADVDTDDFLLFKTAFAEAQAAAGTAVIVPEPGALALGLFGALAGLVGGRRR